MYLFVRNLCEKELSRLFFDINATQPTSKLPVTQKQLIWFLAPTVSAILAMLAVSSCNFSKSIENDQGSVLNSVAPTGSAPELRTSTEATPSPSATTQPSPLASPSLHYVPASFAFSVRWQRDGQDPSPWVERTTAPINEGDNARQTTEKEITLLSDIPNLIEIKAELPMTVGQFRSGQVAVELVAIDESSHSATQIPTTPMLATENTSASDHSTLSFQVQNIQTQFSSERESRKIWMLTAKQPDGTLVYSNSFTLRTLPTEFRVTPVTLSKAIDAGVMLNKKIIRPEVGTLSLQLMQVILVENFGINAIDVDMNVKSFANVGHIANQYAIDRHACFTNQKIDLDFDLLSSELLIFPIDDRLQPLIKKFENAPESLGQIKLIVEAGGTKAFGVYSKDPGAKIAKLVANGAHRKPSPVTAVERCHAQCPKPFNHQIPTNSLNPNGQRAFEFFWDELRRLWRTTFWGNTPFPKDYVASCLNCYKGDLSACDACRAFEEPSNSSPRDLHRLYCSENNFTEKPTTSWEDSPENGTYLEGTEDIALSIDASPTGLSAQIRYSSPSQSEDPVVRTIQLMTEPVVIRFDGQDQGRAAAKSGSHR